MTDSGRTSKECHTWLVPRWFRHSGFQTLQKARADCWGQFLDQRHDLVLSTVTWGRCADVWCLPMATCSGMCTLGVGAYSSIIGSAVTAVSGLWAPVLEYMVKGAWQMMYGGHQARFVLGYKVWTGDSAGLLAPLAWSADGSDVPRLYMWQILSHLGILWWHWCWSAGTLHDSLASTQQGSSAETWLLSSLQFMGKLIAEILALYQQKSVIWIVAV